jgi:hypothetical protein
MIERRKFLTGLISLVAAPAIVRAGSLMPVKAERRLLFTEYYCNRVIRTYMDVEAIRDRNILLNVYGRSPAMDALPDLRSLSSMYFVSRAKSPL